MVSAAHCSRRSSVFDYNFVAGIILAIIGLVMIGEVLQIYVKRCSDEPAFMVRQAHHERRGVRWRRRTQLRPSLPRVTTNGGLV